MKNIDLVIEESPSISFNQFEINQINKAIVSFYHVLNSIQFKNLICDYFYKDVDGEKNHQFFLSNGLSRNEIYNHIIEGVHTFRIFNSRIKEIFICPFEKEVDKLQFDDSKPVIWLQKKDINLEGSSTAIIATIFEQYCKHLGFNSYVTNPNQQASNNSVPFVIKTIVTALFGSWSERFPKSYGVNGEVQYEIKLKPFSSIQHYFENKWNTKDIDLAIDEKLSNWFEGGMSTKWEKIVLAINQLEIMAQNIPDDFSCKKIRTSNENSLHATIRG